MYITGQQNKELLDTCILQKAKRDTVIKDLTLIKESLLEERAKSKKANNIAEDIIKEVKVLNKKEKRKLKWTEIKAKVTKVTLTTVATISTVTALTLGVILSNKK